MSGPELASKVIRRWFNRRRPNPPRALRIVLEVNGKTFVDISAALALNMITCNYGQPVVMSTDDLAVDFRSPGSVRITFTEVEP